MDPALSEQLEKFHGHTCAGSLMGARLGLAAKAALKAAGGEGKLKARYYNLSCPVDGVQIAAGTTYGNRAIEVEDKGEQRLTLTAEKNGRQVEARLTKRAEEKGALSRELSKKARELLVGSPERQRLEAEVEAIFSWFRTAPDQAIVVIQVVT
ncbi:MAG: formylmethanofuran dehydrogenase subunit E family protein [Nitrospirota bacterium]